MVLWSYLFLLAVAQVLRQSSASKYPADVLNLQNTVMSLQIPNKDSDGGIHTIRQPELLTTSNSNFYTNDDSSAVVLWAQENGGVTENGSGPRSELTEPNNYFTFSGKHTMSYTTKVKEADPSGRVCIGQVKGDSYDSVFGTVNGLAAAENSTHPIVSGSKLIIVELVYDNGELIANLRDKSGNGVKLNMGTYKINESIDVYFKVDGYYVTVKSNKVSQPAYDYSFWKGANYGMHFKVGVYDQGSGSSSSKGGKVELSNLKISHST